MLAMCCTKSSESMTLRAAFSTDLLGFLLRGVINVVPCGGFPQGVYSLARAGGAAM
jgi:hypothetical protein